MSRASGCSHVPVASAQRVPGPLRAAAAPSAAHRTGLTSACSAAVPHAERFPRRRIPRRAAQHVCSSRPPSALRACGRACVSRAEGARRPPRVLGLCTSADAPRACTRALRNAHAPAHTHSHPAGGQLRRICTASLAPPPAASAREEATHRAWENPFARRGASAAQQNAHASLAASHAGCTAPPAHSPHTASRAAARARGSAAAHGRGRRAERARCRARRR
jgi:hypothetical protein